MVDTSTLVESLRTRGVKLFAGVPDSLLQSFSTCLMHSCKDEHIITANEGNAIALAMGHYMASGFPGVVYMQNSGLGNAINPITSLADPDVYSIPMLLVIGWRGEPGHKDEPQHVKQGRITEGQLRLLEIPYWVVDKNSSILAVLDQAWQVMLARSGPVALLVKAGALSEVKSLPAGAPSGWPSEYLPLYREVAINRILDLLRHDDILLATTGKTGREVFELRTARGELQHDFLTVGGMGHAASIALGVSLAQPERRVICLDGDGALLMHMGGTAIIGDISPPNFIHILLNNQSHESVGGQPTVAGRMDFSSIGKGCRYQAYHAVHDLAGLEDVFTEMNRVSGPQLLEIHLWQGSRKDLGRPTSTPQQNKTAFMAHVQNTAFR